MFLFHINETLLNCSIRVHFIGNSHVQVMPMNYFILLYLNNFFYQPSYYILHRINMLELLTFQHIKNVCLLLDIFYRKVPHLYLCYYSIFCFVNFRPQQIRKFWIIFKFFFATHRKIWLGLETNSVTYWVNIAAINLSRLAN